MPKKVWFETSLGQRYEFPETAEYPITIGRVSGGAAKKNAIAIAQSKYTMSVSRKHAEIYCDNDGNWEILDAGASHGMSINDVRVKPSERHPLTAGTKVSLGKFEVYFQIEGQEVDLHDIEDEDDGEGKTMILDSFTPTDAAPTFDSPDETVEEDKRLYLDVWLDGRLQPLEFPQIPGVDDWTVGRQVRKPPRPVPGQPVIDHVQIPNVAGSKSISRKHIQLSKNREDGWTLKCLSSQTVMINDKKVATDEEAKFEIGDHLVMGNLVFIFRKGAVEKAYEEEDFDLAKATGGVMQSTMKRDTSDMPTREIPRGVTSGMGVGESSTEKVWGYLVENKLLNPKKHPLSKRKIRIGSHPLNSDLKMEGGGITDFYAQLQWGAKDVKIASKVTNSPVRVNHAPYRTSPALKDGDIITLGTREFNINIIGEPPVSTSSVIAGTIRRSILLFVIVLVLAISGGLAGVKIIYPNPVTGELPVTPNPQDLITDVVLNYGLSGLKMLEQSDANTKENEPIFLALQSLNQAHAMIHQYPAARFDENVTTIEKKIAEGRKVFKLAGLNASQASDWFSKEIDEVFDARRFSAYAVQWNDFLKGLEKNNIANARRQLSFLTHFPKDKLDNANAIVNLWVEISRKTLKKNENDILIEFRNACKQSRSTKYIQDEGKRLDKLVADFDSIINNKSDPAKALTKSDKWAEYHHHVKTLRSTLSLLEHYQAGNTKAFNNSMKQVNAGSQTKLVNTMKSSLDTWEKWLARRKASKDPLADFKLLSDLQQIVLLFRGSLDDNSPLAKRIASNLKELQSGRVTQAKAIRDKSKNMADDFPKLMKLLQAYDYDPNDKAEEEIDRIGVKLCGKHASAGTVSQQKENFQKVLKRYNELIKKGVMSPDSVVSRRQIQKILEPLK